MLIYLLISTTLAETAFCGIDGKQFRFTTGFGLSTQTPFDLSPCAEDIISLITVIIALLAVSFSFKPAEPVGVYRNPTRIKIYQTLRTIAAGLILSINLTAFFYFSYSYVMGTSLYHQGQFTPPPISVMLSSGASISFSVVTFYISFYLVDDSLSFLLTTLWLVVWAVDLVRLRTMISLDDHLYAQLGFTLTILQIISEFLFIMLCGCPLKAWATVERKETTSPEIHAHYFSRIFFFWVWPLLLKGSRTPLGMDDIYQLDTRMSSEVLHKRYQAAWKEEAKVRTSQKANLSSSAIETVIKSIASVFAMFRREKNQQEEFKQEDNQRAIFLAKVLFRAFGWEYMSAGVLRLIMICLTYVSPQLMTLLLQYVQSKTLDPVTGLPVMRPQPTEYGISIVVTMLLIMLLNVALSSMFTWICDMATYKARSALMTDIFKKSLRLKNPMDTGEIVNRFSADTSAVTGSFAYLHLLWAAPIEIAVTLYLLYGILGPSSFIALATSLLIGLISYLVVPFMVRKTETMLLLNDKRINLVNGTINFAQTIKLYAWENVFVKKITDARNAQLKELGSVMVITAFIGGLMSSAVNLIILSSLATYALTAPPDKPLDLARIFVGMSLLNTLQAPLNTLSGVYSQVMQLSISFRRLTQLLCAEEVEGPRKVGSGKVAISIRQGSFKTFGDEPKVLLRNVNVDIPRDKLTAVVGPTGCGKSSLLGAFSGGVLTQESGKMVKNMASMVFLPQQPWIFSGSIRENILFHAPYEPEWYKKVVSVSALKPDFEIMKGKDMAQMTDGNNLSGGQKQRVALARAVYSKTSEVFLFDDPLSAVDARVSAQIFEQVMGNNGVLKDKTRVLTTNRLDLLPRCDHIVVMENGTVLAQGTFRELMTKGSAQVKAMIQPQVGIPMASVREDDEGVNDAFFPEVVEYIESYSTIGRKPSYTTIDRRPNRRISGIPLAAQNQSQMPGAPVLRRRNATITRLRSKASGQMDGYGLSTLGRSGTIDRATSNTAIRNAAFDVDDEEEDARNMAESQKYQVVQEEMQQRGRLSYNLYAYYIRNCSYVLASIVGLLLLINLGVDAWNEIWLQAWGQSNITGRDAVSKNFFYLGIFTVGTIGATFLAILLDLVAIRYMALKASKKMHVKALDATMGAPISFFHANPAGRIINRFSNDILSLDRTIPQNLLALINALLSALMSTLLACIASYYVIFIAILMGFFYWTVLNFFMKTVRELRRLVLTSQSPTLQFLSESMIGILTIRGFGREAQSAKRMQDLIDTNSKVFYSTFAVSSWLATTIQFLSFMLTVPVLFLTVTNGGSTNSGFLAIALTNALNVSGSLQAIVQAYISMEISLVSIERIKEYIDRKSEISMRAIDKQITPPPNWPTRGEIKFRNYSTSYAHDETSLNQDLVLKNITLTFEAGMRIGIVGRTGAGKSSMVLALFQLLRARGGTISIDGLDLAKIDLKTVRSRIAIIPQEAMVFPGTIRDNLDPALVYSDDELWRALDLVGLSPMVKTLQDMPRPPQPGQPPMIIPAGMPGDKPKSQLDMRFPGERLSMGESQLFCLCRAILLRSKIVVLDEPTANIDMQTDQHIQRVIREVFQGCTIITIAHRIATIQDFDRVLVLDKGMVKEFGNPAELLRDPRSEFSKLANNIAADA